MSGKFPHLTNNESSFPNVEGVNVYQYDNKFDYTKFDYSQMHLLICNVPWDMGEAHIGARTISGIGNVVHFGSEAKRDAWFNAIPDDKCYRFDTKYRNLHRDEYIDVPLPFDVAAKYNYLAISYELVANSENPLMYETENGLRKWFWFIREVEFIAPNTTRLHVLNDAFQTFIYEIDVTGMILARGHAPMIESDITTYLSNPIANCDSLLAEDVNYGSGQDICVKSYEKVFNEKNMGALVICNSNAQNGSWGSKGLGTWNTPGQAHLLEQGNGSYLAFFIKGASNITSFLNNVDSNCPQFMQTIQAVAFISQDLLTLGATFTFCSTNCYLVEAVYKKTDFATLAKEDFGYDLKYSNITKLYTYPYAYLEITDEMGNVTEVRIENTNGKITVEHSVSLVYPWLNINAHISNIGKASRKSISFANATTRNIPIGGKWYDYLYKWEIPTFAVTQDAAINNDFSTHFDRAQQQTAATNQLANENNTANANRSNATIDANLTTAIGNLQIALNNANTTASNAKTSASESNSNAMSSGNTAAASAFTSDSVNNQIDYQYATGSTAAVSAAVNGAVSGGTTLAAGGPYAAAAGAVIGGVMGAIGSAVTMQAGVNYTDAQEEASQTQMSRTNLVAQTATSDEATAAITFENSKNSAANSYTSGASAANAAAITSKATNTYNAATANATNNYNTATSAIANQVNQAALNAPEVFGDFANGDDAANKPIALFANIVTQNDYAISRAGDEMLRYGYMYGKQWEFDGNWTPGEKFTYWKLEDFWVRNLNVGDMYMDKLRFFLYGGVTIWKSPEDIGNVSIYENGF